MEQILRNTDKWLQGSGPHEDVIISSRARYARNLAGRTFAAHSSQSCLKEIVDEVDSGIDTSPYFKDFQKINVPETQRIERACLKESRQISIEVEKGNPFQCVYVSTPMNQSIMINEEDHLRMQAILPGFQIDEVLRLADQMDNALGEFLTYTYSEKLGFLTACPTNTGTGLRISVMLHLPGLALKQKIENVLTSIQPHGLTIRGFYGENTESTGDFFQISNEVTLGRTEEEIANVLSKIIGTILEQEIDARQKLFRDNESLLEDYVWRSFGQLCFARQLETGEAMKLLSRIRLGISRGFFKDLTDKQLNQIIVAIQPGHLQAFHGSELSSHSRDVMRAQMLRQRLNSCADNN